MAQLSSHRGTLDHIPAHIHSVDGVQPVRKTENLNICKQLAGVCVCRSRKKKTPAAERVCYQHFATQRATSSRAAARTVVKRCVINTT